MCKKLLVALGFLSLGISLSAQADEPIPQEMVSLVENASSIGKELYARDRATIIATDQLAADGVLQSDERLRGWITESSDDGYEVIYFGVQNNSLIGAHSVSVNKDFSTGPIIVTEMTGSIELTENQIRKIKARQIALKLEWQDCTPNINTVVLGPKVDNSSSVFHVYRFSATTDPNIIQLGGHDRVAIAAADFTVLETKNFSNSCIALERSPNAAGMFVSDVLSPTPTEIHVFVSLQTATDLYVITTKNEYVWKVSGSEISRMK